MNRIKRTFPAYRSGRTLAATIADLERRVAASAPINDPARPLLIEKLRRLRAVQAWRNQAPAP